MSILPLKETECLLSLQIQYRYFDSVSCHYLLLKSISFQAHHGAWKFIEIQNCRVFSRSTNIWLIWIAAVQCLESKNFSNILYFHFRSYNQNVLAPKRSHYRNISGWVCRNVYMINNNRLIPSKITFNLFISLVLLMH